MRTIINFVILNLLLFAASSQCFAMIFHEPVSKERAKELGMEIRWKGDGTNTVWVELEFQTEGPFKSFADDYLKKHSRVELRMVEGLSAALREDRSKPGRILVSFTAARAQLDQLSLWVRLPAFSGETLYTLSVKDFVEPAKSANSATPLPNQPANAQLHRREVNQKNPGGKDLIMTFEELSRDEKTSTATVKRVSGASVPSAMFVLRGAYDIARARGAAYFINLKEWEAEDGARMYLVGFAPDKNVNPQEYFGLKEPLADDPTHQFFAVKVYERIFKDQP
jgi:hypothetical protein